MQGKRLVAFVVGGMTRSEMRVAHRLSVKLGRDILIGSTSCDTPATFLKSLQVIYLLACSAALVVQVQYSCAFGKKYRIGLSLLV